MDSENEKNKLSRKDAFKKMGAFTLFPLVASKPGNFKTNWADEFKWVLPHKGRTYEDFAPGNSGYPGQTDEHHYIGLALYDLRRNPGERYNVIDTYPEEAAKLQKVVERARKDPGDDLTFHHCNYSIDLNKQQ